MDIYEATQKLLTDVVPGANVSAYVLTYDAVKDQFILPDFPAVTYNYSAMTPIVAHDITSSLCRIDLDIEVWGDLEQIDKNAWLVTDALNARRIAVDDVEFTLVMIESRDVAELGLDFKRRFMRFAGLADIAAGDVSN